jgi:RND family efflux transporter MFP subunit
MLMDASKAVADSGPQKVERPDLSVLRMGPEVRELPQRRRWPWLLLLLALAVAAAAWAWLAPAPFLLPKVETATVQVVTQAEASTVLTASGYTYARNRAAVGSRIIGRILDLRVDEGDRVRKGDVIAVLDSGDLQASVREMEADLEEKLASLADASREQARQSRLAAAGVTAQADKDSAATRLAISQAQVGTARARLEAARAQLAYTVIRSPLSGVVVQRNSEVGEMVAPGGFTTQQSTGAIVRIADPASLEVEADINESYIARVQIGQPASIVIDAVPGRQYHGRLRQIVPTADRQKAVVGVKVTVDDADQRLVPDMSTTVTFLAAKVDEATQAAKARLFVASAAVEKKDGKAWVFRVEDNRVRRVEVRLGEERKDQWEILSGLGGGETVVRGGLEKLRDGQRVRKAEA